MNATEKPRTVLVMEMDQVELALRMVEVMSGFKRVPGITNEEAMAAIEPANRAVVMRLAETAILYLGDCAINAVQPS